MCIKVWKSLGGVNCHDSSKLSKEAYYGGRVELFKAHNEKEFVPYTDINSLYPAMMLREFPGPLSPWDYAKEKDFPKFGVARVKIEIPKMRFCPLPFRRDDGSIVYPYGTLTGVWTVHEIHNAWLRGARVLEVYECLGTNEGSKPYETFVLQMYDERMNSNSDAEKLFFKLLMNNLYGRLGTGGLHHHHPDSV